MYDPLVENLLIQWANYNLETFRVLVSNKTLSALSHFKSDIIGQAFLIKNQDSTVCFHFEKKYLKTVLSAVMDHGVPFEITDNGNILLYGITAENN